MTTLVKARAADAPADARIDALCAVLEEIRATVHQAAEFTEQQREAVRGHAGIAGIVSDLEWHLAVDLLRTRAELRAAYSFEAAPLDVVKLPTWRAA
jgi:ectoine hydroxylase-related dioxygenase (phytanoyl-CoA dioxygenase family)